MSRAFWEAAFRGILLIQRCTHCGRHQFYPRPFCISCQSEVEWVEARGTGTIFTKTVVHTRVSEDLSPPYAVAIVELDEGPRIIANLAEIDTAIGDVVTVGWRDRPDLPPFPVFHRT